MLIKDEIIKGLKEGVAGLKYKGDSIRIENVYPAIIEEALGDFDNGYELNGYDCDYWATIGPIEVFGCMRYGYAEFTKTNGPKQNKPNEKEKEEEEEEENVYTRSHCVLKDGTEITDIPDAINVEPRYIDAIVELGYSPYYIVFVNNSGSHKYVVIYAQKEIDARKRAFSIWDRKWDEICNQDEWDKKKAFYGDDFDKKFVVKEGPLAICIKK